VTAGNHIGKGPDLMTGRHPVTSRLGSGGRGGKSKNQVRVWAQTLERREVKAEDPPRPPEPSLEVTGCLPVIKSGPLPI